MKEVCIFDIDGTVCDSSKFAHFLSCKPKNYDAFWAGVPHYDPLPLIVTVKLCMLHDMGVVFSTARDECTRNDTLEWLERHLERPVANENLYMRGTGDYRPDYLLKLDLLASIKSRFGEADYYAWEDIERVQNMYMENDVTVYCPVKCVWLNEV